MKRIQIILALLLAMTVQMAVASDEKGADRVHRELLDTECKFYVGSLDLKGDSAKRFTKIFMDYKLEINKALEKNREHQPKRLKQGARMNDKDLDAIIRARFKLSRSLLDIREKYYDRFRQVLSPSMYERFNMLERHFDNRKVKEHERRRQEPKAAPAEYNRRGKTYKVSPPPE